jgi:hypothetical protein
MPAKKCTNNPRVPINQRETNVSTCYKRGIGIGRRIEQLAQQRRDRPPLNTLTLRRLGDIAREYRIIGYSNMKKQELITALTNANYPN